MFEIETYLLLFSPKHKVWLLAPPVDNNLERAKLSTLNLGGTFEVETDYNLEGMEVSSNSLTFSQGGLATTLSKVKLSDLQTMWK